MSDDFIMRVLRATAPDNCDNVNWTFGEDGWPRFFVYCNGLFYWGCADFEELTPENVGELERAYEDARAVCDRIDGATLFCCRVRKMRPQGFFYPSDRGVWPLLDACGPEREVGLGNPYRPGEYREKREVDGPTCPGWYWAVWRDRDERTVVLYEPLCQDGSESFLPVSAVGSDEIFPVTKFKDWALIREKK